MLKVIDVTHIYSEKMINFKALEEVNLTIPQDKFVILLGQSGSGKTTMLNIIGGLLRPTQGKVLFNDINIYDLSNSELPEFRRKNIGFIFQNYFLDSNFTALENVMVPLYLNTKITNDEIVFLAKQALSRVGLENKFLNKPTQLSGGECQRVAIARALVNNPKLIIADEPTGNLDSKNGNLVIDLLRSQVGNGTSIIMVTHNRNYIEKGDILYEINDGKI